MIYFTKNHDVYEHFSENKHVCIGICMGTVSSRLNRTVTVNAKWKLLAKVVDTSDCAGKEWIRISIDS